jgi:hypothetical protein
MKKISSHSSFVFVGQSPHAPLSNMVFLMILRRMGLAGNRARLQVRISRLVGGTHELLPRICEMALAHTIKNKGGGRLSTRRFA